MGNIKEKSFEERLKSLKNGCIIFFVIEIISLISTLFSVIQGKGNIFSLLIEIAIILLLYFIYKYTSEKNSIGPILEYVFGSLMLIQGIIACVSASLVFGIIVICLAIGVLNEATYFKKYLS